MTLVPDVPTALTDEALRLIGVIAVESARLEWGLAGLVATVTGVSHREALEVRTKQKVEQIVRGLAARPSGWGEGPTEEVIRWARTSAQLLNLRGKLMHSTWIATERDEPVSSHLRTGDRAVIDVQALAQLAHDVRMHAGLGPGMWMMAMHDPLSLKPDEADDPDMTERRH